ncbi:hypothetical protein TNCV_1043371 [Trichonephila clavipes]|nr:hypothetical protein TNCV_1043371 [Trichonephila clavipes]
MGISTSAIPRLKKVDEGENSLRNPAEEKVIRAPASSSWLRNQSVFNAEESYSQKLKQLLKFLGLEVKGKRRGLFEKSGFKSDDISRNKTEQCHRNEDEQTLPTSVALVSTDKVLISELEKKNIDVPNVGSRISDIDLLLGADALALIYAAKLIKLECSLTAVETQLGFALMGKDTKIKQGKSLSTVNEQHKTRSAMTMLSNQTLSLDVKELRSLETIGIRGPVENLKETN